MKDHTQNYQPPTRRQVINEAQRLAADIDWGPFRLNMPAGEVQAVARTPEGLEALERNERQCDAAVDALGVFTRWDAVLLRSALPVDRDDDYDEPEWEHLVRLASITADKKAQSLDERALHAARAALSTIPFVWDKFETDALLEAPKHVDREWVRMSVDDLDPRDTVTALDTLNRVLTERISI